MTAARQRLLQWIACGAIAIVLLSQVLSSWATLPGQPADADRARDFMAFYCAGAARDAGENPYIDTALQRCGAANDPARPSFVRSGVYPAPIPPYDVALFRIFALVPYGVATDFWLAASLIAIAIVVAVMARSTRLPFLVVTTLCALPLFVISATLGQLTPIAAAALAIAAIALRRGRHGIAAAACTIAFIEPHLAVPAFFSMFAWAPRTRPGLVAGAALLTVVSLATFNVATNVSFFTTVLPLHALSQTDDLLQYSLTWLVYFAGASARVAISAGSVSYVVMTIVGVGLARAAARRNDVEAIVFIPLSTTLLGGTYVHTTQIGLAILGALYLVPRVQPRLRLPVWTSVALLAPIWWTPSWESHAWSATRLESGLVVATVAYLAVSERRFGTRLAAAAFAAFLYVAMTSTILHAPETPTRARERSADYRLRVGAGLAYASGRAGLDRIEHPTSPSGTSVRALAFKVPTWLGLIVLLYVSIAWSGRERVDARAAPADGSLALGV